MSKVDISWKVPRTYNPEAIESLFKSIADQLALVSECRQASYYQSRTSAPTTGTYQKGDWVKNSAPAELGSGGSMYIIFGWVNVASGEPGTWRELRVLTGN